MPLPPPTSPRRAGLATGRSSLAASARRRPRPNRGPSRRGGGRPARRPGPRNTHNLSGYTARQPTASDGATAWPCSWPHATASASFFSRLPSGPAGRPRPEPERRRTRSHQPVPVTEPARLEPVGRSKLLGVCHNKRSYVPAGSTPTHRPTGRGRTAAAGTPPPNAFPSGAGRGPCPRPSAADWPRSSRPVPARPAAPCGPRAPHSGLPLDRPRPGALGRRPPARARSRRPT
jgi:hypothetical protein